MIDLNKLDNVSDELDHCIEYAISYTRALALMHRYMHDDKNHQVYAGLREGTKRMHEDVMDELYRAKDLSDKILELIRGAQ